MRLDYTITKVSKEFLTEARNSPSLLSDMAAMEKYMSESYSGRILVELLQNADDAKSHNVLITQRDGCVVFANDGRPFDESDVIAISRSGASQKKRGETIGYRGVGFKSTSFLSNDIIIHSNETSFCFSKSKTAEVLGVSVNSVPTIRIPFIVDTKKYDSIISELKGIGYSTIFLFPNSDVNVLSEEFSFFSDDLLIFLRNIESVHIDINAIQRTINVRRSAHDWGYEICTDNRRWAILENCLCFSYDGNSLTSCEPEESTYYCFLPTCDKSIYNIKINANFSTDPSRKHLRFDDATQHELDKVGSAILSLVQKAIDNPSTLYKNLFGILKFNIFFDKTNRYLKSIIEHKFSSIKLRLNNGKIIQAEQYKSFPNSFDNSTVRILRTTEGHTHDISLSHEVYDNIDEIDSFLDEVSDNKLSNQDIVDIASEQEVIEELPRHTCSFLMGEVVKAYNRSEYEDEEELDVSNVLLKDSYDEVVPLKDSGKTTDDIMELLDENPSNQSISPIRLKKISSKLGLEYKERKRPPLVIQPVDEPVEQEEIPIKHTFTRTIKTDKPVIPKWRSAENACIEIEKFKGNNARDVSVQNLGYDVESTTPDGHKRYIEVKSVKPSDLSFTITNNEYTSAHQAKENYYICLIVQSDTDSKAIYIQDPISKLHFEKRIRQWEWFCENGVGEEIDIDY